MHKHHNSRGALHPALRALALVARRQILIGLVALSGVAQATTVGSGSYRDGLPSGYEGPRQVLSYDSSGNASWTAAVPHTTSTFDQSPTSHKWWTLLMWQYWGVNPNDGINLKSQPAHPYPLMFLARKEGASVGYVATPTVSNTFNSSTTAYPEYHYTYTQDMVVGLQGMSVTEAPRVESYSDWAVDLIWNDGSNRLQMTASQGSPYLYFRKLAGGNAYITTSTAPTVVSQNGNVLVATIAGKHYGFFAPSGSTWTISGSTITSTLAGKSYFSVAVLPDTQAATITTFSTYAFNFILDTRHTWSYDQASATLTDTFTLSTEVMEGSQTGDTLTAVLPHQWKRGATANTNFTYQSARGQMKVISGNRFTTTQKFNGVLPILPDKGDYDKTTLKSMISEIYNDRNSAIPNKVWQKPLEGTQWDAYWTGRAVGRIASLADLADQQGMSTERDYFLSVLKDRIQNWLTYTEGESDQFVAYDSTWRSLIPVPDVHLANTMLNDHHFNHGYFIRAAATVARFDSTWATSWGPMIEQLIKDAANWDRNDTRYPFMRHYSAMDGHTWATGPAFATGQNEESSSESMNFATGVFLWGSVTGNRTIRDTGIMLYTNQANAIEQYWFDVDNSNFPADFSPTAVGMVWGDGVTYSTWWTLDPIEIHGINLMPIQPGSVYLGRSPSYIAKNFATWNQYQAQYTGTIPNGTSKYWQDLRWAYQSMSNDATYNASSAAAALAADINFAPDWGQTRAHIYHWVHNMKVMGLLDTTVTANLPMYNVFNNNGVKTYIAYNPGNASVCASFSDGRTMTVAAKTLVTNGSACSTGGGGDNTPPTVPTGLTVSSPTNSTLTLTWTASTDNVSVANYEVYRNGSLVGSPTGTTFVDRSLSANTNYGYTVRACDGEGACSAQSTEVFGLTTNTVDTQAPSAPSNLAVGSATASSLTLSWTASTDNIGVAKYDVYRNGSLVASPTSSPYTDSALTASTTYSYTLRACDAAANCSAQTSAKTGTTLADGGSTPPPASGGDFGIDSAGKLYHADKGWSATWAYLCLNSDCRTASKANGRFERSVTVSVGTTYSVEFKVQDNTSGQCLSGVQSLTYAAAGSSVPTNCSGSSGGSGGGTTPPTDTPTSGNFGIDSAAKLYHVDKGWSATWSYLCLNSDCRAATKLNGRFERAVSVSAGTSYIIEFKVQDNSSGQCLSGAKSVTYAAAGVSTSSACAP